MGSAMQTATRSKVKDRVLLFVAALSVCVTGGGVVLAFEIHHINQAWFLFAWSSIFLLPLIGKKFRGYFKHKSFVTFFIFWMCVHGAIVVTMIAWLPIVLWPFILLLELSAGFVAAHRLFGLLLHQEQPK